MTPPPVWARGILEEVCSIYNVDHPVLVWRRSKLHAWSSGCTYHDGSRVVVTAGSDPRDRRLVLLHELAHWVMLTRHGPEVAHGPEFWRTAFDLYRAYGMTRYATGREGRTYAGARTEAAARRKRSKP